MFTTMAESMHPVRYVAELHRWMPIHRAASGLAVMAYAGPDQLKDAWDQADDELRAGTSPWRDRDELEATLARIRERGYAMTSGQRVTGAVGIFAPVRTVAGEPVADIGLNIPVHRFDPEEEPDLAETVLRAAHAVETRIR